jgi:hypothetical protein
VLLEYKVRPVDGEAIGDIECNCIEDAKDGRRLVRSNVARLEAFHRGSAIAINRALTAVRYLVGDSLTDEFAEAQRERRSRTQRRA